MYKFFIRLMYSHESLSWLNYFLDFWDTNLGKWLCPFLSYPGDVFYNSGGLEPDYRCKRCLEEHFEHGFPFCYAPYCWLRSVPWFLTHPIQSVRILRNETPD